jgi:oligopeptide/dipeptide ABC transporter ATP-binding protein
VSALDASIGAQIVNLLTDLQQELGLSYLFISHDVALVSRLADRIAVVYLGRIVEEGPPRDVVRRPLHPYTAALLSAVPDPDAVAGHGAAVLPEVRAGSAESIRAGCAFAARCPIVRERCRFEVPPLAEVERGRRAACFYPGELPGPLPEPHVPSRNPGAHPPH